MEEGTIFQGWGQSSMAGKISADTQSKGTKFSQLREGEQGAGHRVEEWVPDGAGVGADPRWGRA